jgi:hypothetical protein
LVPGSSFQGSLENQVSDEFLEKRGIKLLTITITRIADRYGLRKPLLHSMLTSYSFSL